MMTTTLVAMTVCVSQGQPIDAHSRAVFQGSRVGFGPRRRRALGHDVVRANDLHRSRSRGGLQGRP